MRRCSKCKATKPAEAFALRSRTANVRASICRECNRAATKAWAAANTERVRRNNSEWLAANTERARRSRREWKLANPGRVRANRLKPYGLTPAQWDAMLVTQAGCACCGSQDPKQGWVVDHDHDRYPGRPTVAKPLAPGAVRGIVCGACNLLLGHARNDVGVLARAIEYLERNRSC